MFHLWPFFYIFSSFLYNNVFKILILLIFIYHYCFITFEVISLQLFFLYIFFSLFNSALMNFLCNHLIPCYSFQSQIHYLTLFIKWEARSGNNSERKWLYNLYHKDLLLTSVNWAASFRSQDTHTVYRRYKKIKLYWVW